MLRKAALISSAAALLLSAAPARAADGGMEAMQKQIELLSQQVRDLGALVQEQGRLIEAQKARIETQGAEARQAAQQLDRVEAMKAAAVAPAAGEPPGVRVTMSPGPKIESADGKYSFQPFGRVHFDTVLFADDKRDQPDNANFRRARLGFKGNLGADFNYKAEIDFAGEAVNLKEVYLAWTGFAPFEVWAGNFKAPVGLEQNTSTNYMSFIENTPATNAFARDEIIGIAAKAGGDDWSATLGVFNEDAGVNNGTDDEAFSLDGRASADLLRDSPDVLHVGASASARQPNAVAGNLTISGKPSGTGPVMVTTGAIANVDTSYVYAAELAGVFGPFSFQGEYFWNDVDVKNAADKSFSGWYAQAGVIVTGERRPYKGKTGNFDRLRPARPFDFGGDGWGALELLARHDVLDLNDAGAGVNGGRMAEWAAGANWYLTDSIRLMLDYTAVNTDARAAVPDDDPGVFSLRTQWDF